MHVGESGKQRMETEHGKNSLHPWKDKTPRRGHLKVSERGQTWSRRSSEIWRVTRDDLVSWKQQKLERWRLSAYPVLMPRGLQLQISTTRLITEQRKGPQHFHII